MDNDVHTDLAPTGRGLPQRLPESTLRRSRSRRCGSRLRRKVQGGDRPGRQARLRTGRAAQTWPVAAHHPLHAPQTPEAVGKTIAAIACARGSDPFDIYFDLILENGRMAVAIFDYIDEANIRLLLRHPAMMICSDGEALALTGPLNTPPPYFPCSYGEFPGVLERYVRDEPVLTLQEAIRKMTSFPAQRLGLSTGVFCGPAPGPTS